MDSRFRAIESAAFTCDFSGADQAPVEDRSSFKPLFPCGSEPGDSSDESQTQKSEQLLEAACRKGFEDGLQNGCDEARRMSRATLRPGLTAFIHSLNEFCTLSRKLEDQTSIDAMELALAVVERVLGAPVSVEGMDRKELAATIQQVLAEANRLKIHIHPDDLNDLRTLACQEGLEWADPSETLLRTDDSIQKGEMRIEAQTHPRESLTESVLEKLSEIMR